MLSNFLLTRWGRVTHICVSKVTIIGSDNGLSPGRRQAIIWTNAGIFLIGPLGTNFSEILIRIQTFSFKKMHWKMSFAKRRPFSLGLNVLIRPTDPWTIQGDITCRSKIKLYPFTFGWTHLEYMYTCRYLNQCLVLVMDRFQWNLNKWQQIFTPELLI